MYVKSSDALAVPAAESRSATARVTFIVTVAVLLTFVSWALGWGFGREVWLTRLTGWRLFGSDVYLGVWLVFLLMPLVGFALPALLVRRVFGERLADYGLTLGDTRAGVIVLFALVPAYVTLPLISSAAGTDFYYTYLKLPSFVAPWKIAFHLTSYASMMFGYEFLFRGFVLLGIAHALGDTPAARRKALAISALLTALFFAGTPWIFVLCFPLLAVVGGLITFRTRSILYFAFINWTLGIWSDIWEIIHLNIHH